MPFQKRIVFSLMLALVVGTAVVRHSNHASSPATPTITLLRTPHEGIQPRTLVDHYGVLHMIYFKGDAYGGDIEYVRITQDGPHGLWSTDPCKQRA